MANGMAETCGAGPVMGKAEACRDWQPARTGPGGEDAQQSCVGC